VACADAERALQRRIVSNAVRPQLLEVATGGQAIENAEQSSEDAKQRGLDWWLQGGPFRVRGVTASLNTRFVDP